VVGEKLREQAYPLDIHRTICHPPISVESDQAHIELLVDQTYYFCSACMSDVRYDLKRPLLKHWLMREGWEE
jgi:hypothetical protein